MNEVDVNSSSPHFQFYLLYSPFTPFNVYFIPFNFLYGNLLHINKYMVIFFPDY